MRLEEDLQHLLVADQPRVEFDLDHLGVAGAVAAHLLVRRIGGATAGVAAYAVEDARHALEHGFHAPEATASDGREFGRGGGFGGGGERHGGDKGKHEQQEPDFHGRGRTLASFYSGARHRGLWPLNAQRPVSKRQTNE